MSVTILSMAAVGRLATAGSESVISLQAASELSAVKCYRLYPIWLGFNSYDLQTINTIRTKLMLAETCRRQAQ
jgi:hypothetical protein